MGSFKRSAIGDLVRHRREDGARGTSYDPGNPLLTREFGRNNHIAFVLAALIVRSDDRASLTKRLDSIGDGGHACVCSHPVNPVSLDGLRGFRAHRAPEALVAHTINPIQRDLSTSDRVHPACLLAIPGCLPTKIEAHHPSSVGKMWANRARFQKLDL
jgi:hypothetical protein